MRVVLQRVKHASVHVDGRETGSIGQGFLILLCVSDEDDETVRMIRRSCTSKARTVALPAVCIQCKLAHHKDLAAHILKRAVRLSVLILKNAESADLVRHFICDRLYEYFMEQCKKHVEKVAHGEFGADMKVDLLNDGPFTLMLDSKELFPK